MRGGAYTKGLIRGVTKVSKKRWAYLQRGLYAGGGYWRTNTVYILSFRSMF